MSVRLFTDEQAVEVIQDKSVKSIRQVLRKLCSSQASGTNYDLIHSIVKKFKLDTSHWTGQAFAKGRRSPLYLTAVQIIEKGTSISSHHLKLKLIKDGVKKPECEKCHITHWMGQPTPLELDHINGNHKDNRLHNLRILCPNCHAQCPTNGGKNQKRLRSPIEGGVRLRTETV